MAAHEQGLNAQQKDSITMYMDAEKWVANFIDKNFITNKLSDKEEKIYELFSKSLTLDSISEQFPNYDRLYDERDGNKLFRPLYDVSFFLGGIKAKYYTFIPHKIYNQNSVQSISIPTANIKNGNYKAFLEKIKKDRNKYFALIKDEVIRIKKGQAKEIRERDSEGQTKRAESGIL